MDYDPTEQDVIAFVFGEMLKSATRDGGNKRQRGEKPPWWKDNHEAALARHLSRWEWDGETKDADSGAHPLVHAAWRALAIAYQETYGQTDPEMVKLWEEQFMKRFTVKK